MRTKLVKLGFEIEGEFSSRFESTLRDIGSVKGDGSVSRCPTKHRNTLPTLSAMEYVTKPILTKDTAQIKRIFETFASAYETKEYHWNKSCGFHVHVSFKPKLPVEIISGEFVTYFMTALQKKYPGEYKRRIKNTFCKPNETEDRRVLQSTDRYYAINMLPAFHKHGTIEFRIFPANAPKKMHGYLRFTLRTVKKFLKDAKLSRQYIDEIDDEPQEKEYNYEIEKLPAIENNYV